ncbi:MAG: hypothetical protein ACEQSB_00555 [Undibacterium sp.]
MISENRLSLEEIERLSSLVTGIKSRCCSPFDFDTLGRKLADISLDAPNATTVAAINTSEMRSIARFSELLERMTKNEKETLELKEALAERIELFDSFFQELKSPETGKF